MALFRKARLKNFDEDQDIQTLFDWINSESETLTVVVNVASVAVSVSHSLEVIPSTARQIITSSTTGTGVVYPGGVAWSTTTVSLTATVAGTYHVVLRK